MPTVLVCVLSEPGHVLPTFPLAEALRARGHEVVYLGGANVGALIESRRFRFVSSFADVVRHGQLMAPNERIFWMAQRRHEELLTGSVAASLGELRPDIMLVDSMLPELALLAYGLEVPCLRMTTSLSIQLDELPPLNCGLAPDAPAIELAVAQVLARTPPSARHHGRAFGEWPVLHDSLAALFGYPSSEICYDSLFAPNLRLIPELVLCPAAFDFPRQRPRPHLVAAVPADVERAERVSDELRAFVERGGPLMYLALGTQADRYAEALPLFAAMLAVMAKHPEWRAVIATGPRLATAPELASPTSNVLLLHAAPQLWLLQRATLFVTHAGLGSVREAISLHVPMLAVPQALDQPGNAARIVYHGLGVALREPADPPVLSPSLLEARLGRVLRHRDVHRSRLASMADAFRKEESEQHGVRIVEQWMAPRPTLRAATLPKAPPCRPETRQPETCQPTQTCEAWLWTTQRGELIEGGQLQLGATLRSPDSRAPAPGGPGFTACIAIGDALVRARGETLVRVELSGDLVTQGPYVAARAVRCLWLLDATSLLYAHAEWCAERALEAEREVAPETVDFFMNLIRQQRALVAERASPEVLEAAWQASKKAALPLWYRGYSSASNAVRPRASDAARSARWHALHVLARRKVEASIGTRQGAEAYARERRALSDSFDAELANRIREHAPDREL